MSISLNILGNLRGTQPRKLQVSANNFGDEHIPGRGASVRRIKDACAEGSLVAVKRLKLERVQTGFLFLCVGGVGASISD